MTATQPEKRLLLIHGWGFGTAVWIPLLDELDRGITVIAPSLPGYDGRQVSAATVEEVIISLTAYLTAPAVVVGWSLGGLLALELAQRYPGRVQALGLIASLPCFRRGPDWAAGWDDLAQAAVRSRLHEDAAAACRYVAALSARGHAASASVKHRLLTAGVPQAAALGRDLEYLACADKRTEFAALKLPVMAWYGAGDALLGGDSAAAVHILKPEARIKTLAGCGHALLIDRARRLARDVESLW